MMAYSSKAVFLILLFLPTTIPEPVNKREYDERTESTVSAPTTTNDGSKALTDILTNLGNFAQVALRNFIDRAFSTPQQNPIQLIQPIQPSNNLAIDSGQNAIVNDRNTLMNGLSQIIPNQMAGGRLFNCPRCQEFDDKMLTGNWRMIYASDNFIKVHLETMMKLSMKYDSDSNRNGMSANIVQQQFIRATTPSTIFGSIPNMVMPFRLPVCVKWQVGQPHPSTSGIQSSSYEMQYAFKSGTVSGTLRVGYGAIQKSTSTDSSFTLQFGGGQYAVRFCLLSSNFPAPAPPTVNPPPSFTQQGFPTPSPVNQSIIEENTLEPPVELVTVVTGQSSGPESGNDLAVAGTTQTMQRPSVTTHAAGSTVLTTGRSTTPHNVIMASSAPRATSSAAGEHGPTGPEGLRGISTGSTGSPSLPHATERQTTQRIQMATTQGIPGEENGPAEEPGLTEGTNGTEGEETQNGPESEGPFDGEIMSGSTRVPLEQNSSVENATEENPELNPNSPVEHGATGMEPAPEEASNSTSNHQTAGLPNSTLDHESSTNETEANSEQGELEQTGEETGDESSAPASLVHRDTPHKETQNRNRQTKRQTESETPLYMILTESSSVSSCQNFIVLTNNEEEYFDQLDTTVMQQLRLLSADTDANPLQYIGCPCGFSPF